MLRGSMDRGPLACTDAERRAALALAARLRGAGRPARIEARWHHVSAAIGVELPWNPSDAVPIDGEAPT